MSLWHFCILVKKIDSNSLISLVITINNDYQRQLIMTIKVKMILFLIKNA